MINSFQLIQLEEDLYIIEWFFFFFFIFLSITYIMRN